MKVNVFGRCAEAQRTSRQVKILSEQLQQAKAKQENQEKLIHTMKKVFMIFLVMCLCEKDREERNITAMTILYL